MRLPRSRPRDLSRRTGTMLAAAGVVILALSCGSSGGAADGDAATTTPAATGSVAAVSVGSTLDGRETLPHRIRWEASPDLPESEVSEVDFLIDGQLAFVEEHAPYAYGRDGGYLVTSFLAPGEHDFTVRVITVGGESADSTVKAKVTAAPAPPDGLDGSTWARTVTRSDLEKATSSEPPPTGRWGLTIGSVGWMIHDPEGGGLLFDVAFPSPGQVELRPSIERPPFPSPTGGAFCEEPDPSTVWTYELGDGGKSLTVRPVGHDPCGDRLAILEGTWSSKSG